MVNQETIQKVRNAIKQYAEYGSLALVCEMNDIGVTALFKVRAEVPLVDQEYKVARMVRADVLADEITEIADTELNPHRARIRCDARRWACSVFNRQVYGDKIDMTIDGRVDLTVALNEARVRLMGDLVPIKKGEAIDIPFQSLPSSTDLKSVDPIKDPVLVDPFDND